MSLPRSQIASKMASLRQKLEDIREYKRILTEEGIRPDAEDKVLESELIQRLLGFEKDLARMDAVRGRRRPDETKKKGPKNKPSKGLLDGVKKDLSKVKAKNPDAEPRWGGRPSQDDRRGRSRYAEKTDSRADERTSRGPKPGFRTFTDRKPSDQVKPKTGKPAHKKDGPKWEGPKKDGPKKPFAKKDGPKWEGPKKDGPKKPFAKKDGPKWGGPQKDGAKKPESKKTGPKKAGVKPGRRPAR
jgi:hypothetical protein